MNVKGFEGGNISLECFCMFFSSLLTTCCLKNIGRAFLLADFGGSVLAFMMGTPPGTWSASNREAPAPS